MYRGESYNGEDDPDGWWPGQSLKDYVENISQPREVSYSRYWHGYLVVLKPLLLLTTFNNIRLINATLQLILTGLVILALEKRCSASLAKAYLVSIPFLFFVSTFSSLSLSICLYLMLFGLLVQCKWEKQLYHNHLYGPFFLVLGMFTAYFDFLTYPLITLGYPLCVYFYLHSSNWQEDIKRYIFYIVQWFVGYGGLWAAKWAISDIFTESITMKDALEMVFVRTQSAENASRISGFFRTIMKNADVYVNLAFLIVIVAVMVFAVLKVYQRKGTITLKISSSVIFILIALLPFVWYFVTQNHSEQHWQFTCRILAVTVFSGVTGMIKICECSEEKLCK